MITFLSTLLFYISILQQPPATELYIKNMSISASDNSDKLLIRWESFENSSFRILRSKFNNREFIEIAVSDGTEYIDSDIEKGVVYWYRIIQEPTGTPDEQKKEIDPSLFINEAEYTILAEILPVLNDTKKNKSDVKTNEKNITTEKINSYCGYTENAPFPGSKLDILIKQKNSVLKIPAEPEKKKAQTERLEYLKQYYMNKVKFSLIMTMAKPYLARDELIIYSSLENYEIKKESKQFIFYDKGLCSYVVFESSKLFKIINNGKDSELADILLKNAELFCTPSGKKIITDKNGVTRIVNYYDAVGLSTRYLKNDRDWRSRTVMLATSRKDLKKMLKKASKTEEQQ